MLFNNPTQFAVLALVLAIGWLFGFASHTGGRKWKRAYRDEAAARAADRHQYETRLSAAEDRAAALEQEKATLAARDITRHRDTGAPLAAAAGGAGLAAAAARPAFGGSTPAARRSWFDWSRGDDLTRLRGIDAPLAARLRAERVTRFADIAVLTGEDEIALERRLDLPAGYIQREQWREQARLLADGRADGTNDRRG